jgi:hypothetical protein
LGKGVPLTWLRLEEGLVKARTLPPGIGMKRFTLNLRSKTKGVS